MSFENLFGSTLLAGALVGLVAAFWGKLKALAWRAASLVIVRFAVDETTGIAMAEYLWRHGKRSRYGELTYGGGGRFVKDVDREILVAWEKIGQEPLVFWFGNRPILAGFVARTKGDSVLSNKLTLTFIRGTFSPDDLVKLAVDEYNATRHGDGSARKRFNVRRMVGRAGRMRHTANYGSGSYGSEDGVKPAECGMPDGDNNAGRRYVGWDESQIGPPAPPDPLGPLAFPPEVDALVVEGQRWMDSEKWYKERRIPWRRGWLLFGPPGTGKSSLARAVAVKLDLVLFVIELGTFDDAELIELWAKIKQNTPCMVVIEDIDGVFHGRENVMGENGGGLNFGTLLNCISGVDGSDGILVVVTTNHLEHIDPALGLPDGTGRSTRPGRIDRAVELTVLDAECRQKIAERILADCPDEVEAVVRAGEGLTGAQFQEMCTRVALEYHWNKITAEDAGRNRTDDRLQETLAT